MADALPLDGKTTHALFGALGWRLTREQLEPLHDEPVGLDLERRPDGSCTWRVFASEPGFELARLLDGYAIRYAEDGASFAFDTVARHEATLRLT